MNNVYSSVSSDISYKLPLSVNGGCSGKISKELLNKTLSGLDTFKDSRVMIDSASGDDAGIIRLNENEALVLTLDVFSPMTENPYDFGQIAAANALSDLYAMRAHPLSVLSFISFPAKTLDPALMREILRGGAEKCAEAGVEVIGGHSLNTSQISCGYAAIGTINPNAVITNSSAQVNDVILLTKPLGNGIATFAHTHHYLSDMAFESTISSMKMLNKSAAEHLETLEVHALCDVTGFGFIGHLSTLIQNSQISVELEFDAIPIFSEVKEALCKGVFPAVTEKNKQLPTPLDIDFSNLSEPQKNLLFSPETSGGLLLFMPVKDATIFEQKQHESGNICARIGHVISSSTKPKLTFKPVDTPWESEIAVPLIPAKEESSSTACSFTFDDTANRSTSFGEIPFIFAQKFPQFCAGKWGIIFSGILLGTLFVLLSTLGNPSNMGLCIACFLRDSVGAMGLHSFPGGAFIRPELIGLVIGTTLSAICFGEFKSRSAPNTLISFLLGGIGMSSALLFLGCPWRAVGRLFSGDLTAFTGVLGFIVGIWIGTFFLKNGFEVGRKVIQNRLNIWFLPVIALGLLFLIFMPSTSITEVVQSLPPYRSVKGPATFHAPIWITLICGLVLGILLQRSHFCVVGAIRDYLMFKNTRTLLGLLAFCVTTAFFAFFFVNSPIGFENHAFTHSYYGLSFMAMLVGGVAFTLAGGCPGRQIIMAGSGDGNALFFVLGMIVVLPILSAIKLLVVTPQNYTHAWILCVTLAILTGLIGFAFRQKH